MLIIIVCDPNRLQNVYYPSKLYTDYLFFLVLSMGLYYNILSSKVGKNNKGFDSKYNNTYNMKHRVVTEPFFCERKLTLDLFSIEYIFIFITKQRRAALCFFMLAFLHVYYFFPQWNTIHNRYILRTYLPIYDYDKKCIRVIYTISCLNACCIFEDAVLAGSTIFPSVQYIHVIVLLIIILYYHIVMSYHIV